ncbi:SRPBCC family protein [Hymenobacter sp. B81]|uniref:SRPBCC family protein n=1 Tax=Hymenobacter sp. B81 TaxID=3344878 RepID=UPI0037DD7880
MNPTSTGRAVVSVERRITIQRPCARVFAYAADLRNDASWRREVHQTLLDAPQPALGAVATEDAYLSAQRPHSLTRLQYAAYEPDRYVRCTTAPDSPHWMSLERTFRSLGPGTTEFVYALGFEQKLVQQALGFAPPRWFLRWYTGWMMGRYQRRLQQLLEAEA